MKKTDIVPRSFFLTVTAVMTGGTQLVEGAHLTGGDTRFCRESSKSRGFYDRGSENTIPCRKYTWKTSLIGLLFFIVHIYIVPFLMYAILSQI